MNKAKMLLDKTYRHFLDDSLFRNSVYIMLGNAMLAFFGFLFWTICAHLYSAHDIGLATAIIAATSVIMQIGTLGFNVSVIKFMPEVDSKNNLINSSLTLVVAATAFVSIIFLLLLGHISPKIIFINSHLWMILSFIVLLSALSVNQVSDAIFIAFRKAEYNFISNCILSISKITLPILLISRGSYGIFIASSLAGVVALVFNLHILQKKYKVKLRPMLDKKILKKISTFSIGNYFVSFFSGIALTVLPLIITNKLTPEQGAYFYFDAMLITLLYVIPISVSSSMLAEGSSEKHDRRLLIKASKTLFMFLLPSIIIYIVFGKYILSIFGQNYAQNGYQLLVILSLSSIFVGLSQLYFSYYRVTGQLIKLNIIIISTSLLAIILGYTWAERGINFVGLLLASSQLMMLVLFIIFNKPHKLSIPEVHLK